MRKFKKWNDCREIRIREYLNCLAFIIILNHFNEIHKPLQTFEGFIAWSYGLWFSAECVCVLFVYNATWNGNYILSQNSSLFAVIYFSFVYKAFFCVYFWLHCKCALCMNAFFFCIKCVKKQSFLFWLLWPVCVFIARHLKNIFIWFSSKAKKKKTIEMIDNYYIDWLIIQKKWGK